jgi:aminoglycoside N3'-acetyltransferase
MITKPFLIDEFRALGMTAGDTIFVHSAYSTLSRAPGGVEGGPQTVIQRPRSFAKTPRSSYLQATPPPAWQF